jgi:hypothetical protein
MKKYFTSIEPHIEFGVKTENRFKNKTNLKRPKNNSLWLIFAIIPVLFGSCRSTYYLSPRYVSPRYGDDEYTHVVVKIDAYSGENLSDKKVALLVCNDVNIPRNDLKNMEFEGYIKKMLEEKGYTVTSDQDKAEVAIFYEYGISNPIEHTVQRTEPVWGQTGISSSTTTQKKDLLGRTVFETYNTPQHGIVGSNVVTDTKITYLRWVNINAYDAGFYRKTGEDKMLWIVEVTSEGSSDDLRYVFPYMMAAAGGHIGQSSGAKKTEKVREREPRLLEMKYPGRYVTLILNEPTDKKIDISVHKDVYRNGKLFIKAGTPVSADKEYISGYSSGIKLSGFSTTSVDGNRVSFGKEEVSFAGNIGTSSHGAAGTLLYLRIEE